MRKTAQQVWEEADEGQAFACQFIPDQHEDIEDTPEVVWRKGYDVDDLDWDTLLWITPVSYGEQVYR